MNTDKKNLNPILITGINGQLGSYLAEKYLDKGYKVHGLKRRSSQNNLGNIEHLLESPNLIIHEGDITDISSLLYLFSENKFVACINTAGQSHVHISFNNPGSTFDITGKGVLNLLELIRRVSPTTKFIQMSSSEMFGNQCHPGSEKCINGRYQNEKTPMVPVSPYAVAKLAGYHYTRLYRETYDIFATNLIAFNFESIPGNYPLLIKNGNTIDTIPIEDMFKSESHRYEGIKEKYYNYEVWTGDSWTKILGGNAYQDKQKENILVQTRNSCYEATADHVAFDKNNNEKPTKQWTVGEEVYKCHYPKYIDNTFSDLELSEFIGFLVGDGTISDSGKIRLINSNKILLVQMGELLANKFGWTYRINNTGIGSFKTSKFDIYHLDINNDSNFGKWLKNNIYTKFSKHKRVPSFILNANDNVRKSFIKGYYAADGKKKGNESWEYKGCSTNSATLAFGISMIMEQTLKQTVKVKLSHNEDRRIYVLQFNKSNDHSYGTCKNLYEIIKIQKENNKSGWFYDITTESSTFCVGPNLFKIHNSPRRGEQFVTRKITKWLGEYIHWEKNLEPKDLIGPILYGNKNILTVTGKSFAKLALGNIDSIRDWNSVHDVCSAIDLMLNHHNPGDWCVSSGEKHTIRDFLKEAFTQKGLKWEDFVYIDKQFLRPNDLSYLCGDSTKIRQELGWSSTVSFKELVKEMVDSDVEKAKAKSN